MTKLWTCLINLKTLLSNHPLQRKLRRSFGSQPVGCLVGARQPEAGVAVQVTQDQSSRWTFLSSDDGDLANLVAGDQGGATRALSSRHCLGISSTFCTNVERFASVAPQDHAKPSLARATIQASPQISPLSIVLSPLSNIFPA